MALTNAARLLREYLAGAATPAEADMARDCLSFIAAHPDCLWRTCLEGHLTGSAWIVNPARTRTLLVHHRKLGRWLQPGGHADGQVDLAAVALREGQEETGIAALTLVHRQLFDFDRHRIPARGAEPEHWHYDFRFLFSAGDAAAVTVSDESHAVRWFSLEEAAAVAAEESVRRLIRKTAQLLPER